MTLLGDSSGLQTIVADITHDQPLDGSSVPTITGQITVNGSVKNVEGFAEWLADFLFFTDLFFLTFNSAGSAASVAADTDPALNTTVQTAAGPNGGTVILTTSAVTGDFTMVLSGFDATGTAYTTVNPHIVGTAATTSCDGRANAVGTYSGHIELMDFAIYTGSVGITGTLYAMANYMSAP